MSAKTNTDFGFWSGGGQGEAHLPRLEVWIAPDWQPTDKAGLLRYIEQSPVVVAASTPQTPCLICDKRLSSSSFQSDGVWLWPQDLIHYLNAHQVRLPEALVEHIRAKNHRPPEAVTIDIDRLSWP